MIIRNELTQRHNAIHSKQWHAIYTRPRCEKQVNEKLASLQVETYFPTHIEVRQWHDRRKKIMVPVFPGYLFVRLQTNEIFKVHQTKGFVRFLTTAGTLDTIPDQKMRALKHLLASDFQLCSTNIAHGARVSIVSGPLKGLEGIIEQSCKNRGVVVIIELLNRSVKTLLRTSQIQRINKPLPMAS